ncbi:hypothetical protein ES288_D10G085600v1 [Gossypium darwinii]|uniref:Lipoyl-binding domain-containing protein n=1 Tax=Gossypium darwinii TaxID=34276 RepID=A0A5D2AXX6_GOSDA|nr:hypothetical protein ES288_D10G085600v1 [Gossypium darwinii]
MATCSLGVPNIKIPKLCFGICIRQRPVRYTSLVRRLEKAFSIGCSPTLETQAHSSSSFSFTTTNLGDDSKETKMSGSTSQLIPSSSGVESLVRDICSTTSIAEFELKLGGFRLYMVRNLAGNSEPPPPILSPPPVSVSTNKTVEAPKSNGTVSTPSSVITRPLSSSGRIESFLDKAADEGLVGFLMRSRTIKGKRAPPSCKEQIVKEGQVLCYIEQLGCEIPIASDVSGEVIKILQEDGDSIGYGDALIAILPSFPGIKKLQ